MANNFSPDGFPVFGLGAAFGHREVAEYLFAKGADEATNGTGYDALTGAVASGHAQIAGWLLDNGANADYRYGGVFAVAYGGGQRAPRNRENADAAWRGFARQDE